MENNELITKSSWEDFRDSGMLWWANRILHIFGWCIVITLEDGKIVEVFPARTTFRGFSEEAESNGFKRVTQFMKDNIDELSEEVNS